MQLSEACQLCVTSLCDRPYSSERPMQKPLTLNPICLICCRIAQARRGFQAELSRIATGATGLPTPADGAMISAAALLEVLNAGAGDPKAVTGARDPKSGAGDPKGIAAAARLLRNALAEFPVEVTPAAPPAPPCETL